MRPSNFLFCLSAACIALVLGLAHIASAEPTMGEYTSYPVFQVNSVAPNILIMMDNSGSMNQAAYTGDYNASRTYYGYFESGGTYTYGSNVFERDPNGDWSGNFLNWLTMRRVDVARKALMGGLATSRQGGGNQHNIGEAPSQDRPFTKSYSDSEGNTPLTANVTKQYLIEDGYMMVDRTGDGDYNDSDETYKIEVEHDLNEFPDEEHNFVNGNLAGVLQKIGTKARWGLEFFNTGTGDNESGGYIANTMNSTSVSSLITNIQNKGCNTWTPLAEAYYVATQYYKQQDVESGLDYPNNVIPNSNDGDDPYYFAQNKEFVHCAKSFVLLLTDGSSTMDHMIPEDMNGHSYRDYDEDGTDLDSNGYIENINSDAGTDFLDDTALYARTADLRADLNGTQNMILYPVYAFGDNDRARQLLQDAAKNGGFKDKNYNDLPDLQSEWDEDGDGVPDTYFEAQDGLQLEKELTQAINAILERAASGTAVSVLATSQEGEGNIIQAYFRPRVTVGTTSLKWLGYLHSLWVDNRGNLREDTNDNLTLDLGSDEVVQTFTDPSTGATRVRRYDVSSSDPYPDENSTYEIIQLQDIDSLWEAGKILSATLPSERDIFTYLDRDGDNATDDNSGKFDQTGEVVEFHTDSDSLIAPYLGVADNATWSHLGSSQADRVDNIIDFVRGSEISGLRTRDVGNSTIWKLGDIVHSTPVVVNRPVENYHAIYGDESYFDYYQAFKDRESMVYVGANDGLFHAFTSWKYDPEDKQYKEPSGAETGETIGQELWAYAPQNLLPHLKWLPDPDYTHVYYVDQKPKVFDAKILPDDKHYTDDDTDPNWGTFVLCGMRMGGKQIPASGDFDGDGSAESRDFRSAYFCLDVTEPRDPELLWERSYEGLELTTSRPAIVHVGDKWYATFGSGPETFDGTVPSKKNGYVYVVDLETGEPVTDDASDWLFATDESSAFMSSPAALDKGLNFNVDAIYIGETYSETSGKLYKINVPIADSMGDFNATTLDNYSQDPLDSVNPWTMETLFDPGKPITAAVSLSVDEEDNVWVFGGTGRYYSNADKTNDDTQYMFGIKDPFYNKDHKTDGYYHSYTNDLELQLSDLFDASPFEVTTEGNYTDQGEVYKDGSYYGEFSYLVDQAQQEDGWYFPLETPKERIIEKPSVLGGIVFTTSFVPNSDICGYGGDSYFYAPYYETGTAYKRAVFDLTKNATLTVEGTSRNVEVNQKKLSIGSGKASSVGIHVGAGESGTAFIQKSTGAIKEENISPGFSVKSGLEYWKEK